MDRRAAGFDPSLSVSNIGNSLIRNIWNGPSASGTYPETHKALLALHITVPVQQSEPKAGQIGVRRSGYSLESQLCKYSSNFRFPGCFRTQRPEDSLIV